MWGKRYAPGDAMTGCDDVIIVEQRTTATTRSDPNVRLLISKIQLLLSLFFLNNNNNNNNNNNSFKNFLPARGKYRNRPHLRRRCVFEQCRVFEASFRILFLSFKNREKESWNETKKTLAKSCKRSPSPLPI